MNHMYHSECIVSEDEKYFGGTYEIYNIDNQRVCTLKNTKAAAVDIIVECMNVAFSQGYYEGKNSLKYSVPW